MDEAGGFCQLYGGSLVCDGGYILFYRTAVKCALEGVTGKMITFKRADGEEYSLEYGLVDVCDVCNKEKPFPTEWITGNNNDISPEFANYALPLMIGVPEHVFEDGVPKYLYRK